MKSRQYRCLVKQKRHARRLRFEHLEDRRLLAAVPQLIDVNDAPASGNPDGFLQLGDSIYFTAAHYETGREFYRMAVPVGTPELVADLQPGTTSSFVDFGDILNDRLIFRTGSGPYKLWSVVEGGAPVLLREFQTTLRFGTYSAIFESEFYFAADDGQLGLELWKTDGTPGSVTLAADLYPGTSHGLPNYLTVFNDALFFVGRSPAGSSQLWKIGAPGEAPVSVDNIYPGNFVNEIHVRGQFGGELFFSANDGIHGRELWKTDGTAGGAVLVKDIATGSTSSSPGAITVMQGIGYFSAQASTAQGYELWRTDGTTAGTFLVGDFTSKTNVSTQPRNLTVWNDRLYFAARDDFTGERLLSTDGTTAGTVEVKYIGRSQTNFGVRQVTDLQVFNDQLVFQIDDRTDELWRSDGTTAGTVRLTAFVDGDDFGIGEVTAIGNLLYFPAGGSKSGAGVELWTSDATAAGTAMFAEINPGTLNAKVRDLVNASGVIYLLAEDNLYRLDPLTRVPKYLGKFDTARELTAVGDRVYFTAYNSIGRKTLYVVDGETVSSVTIRDGAFLRSPPASNLIAMRDELYFSAEVFTSSGGELWKTDGTSAGTVLVADINPGAGDSSPSMGAVIDGFLYFVANDGVHGREWWKSDGTTAGTHLLADINPGTASGVPNNSQIIGVNNQIFFRANDGTHGDELWSVNKSSGMPYLVKDIVVGTVGSSPAWFAPLGDELIFAAYGGVTGREIWKSDGTAGGTIKLSSIQPGSSSFGPVTLTTSGGYVYFGVDSDTAGNRLWKTDGTADGTVLVKQISIGVPNGIVAAADHEEILYFSATNPNGNELWRSDGTPAGTYQVVDLAPGSAHSRPRELFSVGGSLYFIAENHQFGRELWVIRSPSELGDYNDDGFVDYADYELWRANYGAISSTGLQADGNGDGVVDAADYTVWRDRLSAPMVPATAQASTTVLSTDMSTSALPRTEMASAEMIAGLVTSPALGTATVMAPQQSAAQSTPGSAIFLELTTRRDLNRTYQYELRARQTDVQSRDAALESLGDRIVTFPAVRDHYRTMLKSVASNESLLLAISYGALGAIPNSSLEEPDWPECSRDGSDDVWEFEFNALDSAFEMSKPGHLTSTRILYQV